MRDVCTIIVGVIGVFALWLIGYLCHRGEKKGK